MKVALVQYSPEFENIEANKSMLDDILSSGITDEKLIIFPEMTLTGFTMNPEKFSESENGASTVYFAAIAQKFEADVIAGIIEHDDNGKLYNSLIHFDRRGSIIARFRKIHLFSYAGEENHYSPWDEGVITEIDGNSTGLSICYDLRFPELYRQYGKKRAKIIINIANWPRKRIEHWKLLLRARAVENLCYVIGVNRTGEDPGNLYNGNSAVIDPLGEVIVMKAGTMGIISVSIDLSQVDEIRREFPFLDDIKLI